MRNAIIIDNVIYKVIENNGKECECDKCAFFERCKDDYSGFIFCENVFGSSMVHFEIKKVDSNDS